MIENGKRERASGRVLDRERGSGNVFLRGSTYWCAFYVDGKEHRESCQTQDQAEALKVLRKTLKRVHAHEVKPTEPFITVRDRKRTITDLMDALKTHYELHEEKNSPQNLSNIARVKRDLGHVQALTLTREAVEKYMCDLRKSGLRKATVNRFVQTLRRGYTLAELPAPKIEMLDEGDNVRQGFTSRQVLNRVLVNLPLHLRDLVLFLFLSSWRRGEVLSLTWDNVTPDAIRLRAEHSKEGEARSLALEDELLSLITRRQAVANGPWVFHKNGKRIGEFRKSWARATALAGVPGLLVHDLRRSGIRDLIRADVSPITVMSISGHKTDSMLKRYAILNPADQRAALRRRAAFCAAEKETTTVSATEKETLPTGGTVVQ